MFSARAVGLLLSVVIFRQTLLFLITKLQRIFETTIGYAGKHNRLLFGAKCLVPQNLGSFQIADTVAAKESVEVGAVDVDFAADLGERDDALVTVVLPCLGRDSEQFPSGF